MGADQPVRRGIHDTRRTISCASCHDELLNHARRVGLAVHADWLVGKLVEALFEPGVVPDQ